MFLSPGQALSAAVLLTLCAAERPEIIRCGNQKPSRFLVDIVQSFAGNKSCIEAEPFFKPPRHTIKTYMHILVASEDKKNEPSDSKMMEQFDILNRGFTHTGMRYALKRIDRTVNAAWANGDDQLNMKKHLRRGDYKTLNLYYMDKITTPGGSPKAIILGQCTFPTEIHQKSEEFFEDGCRILKSTLPGGTIKGTSKGIFEGKTTVHEVGHWIGLFHTFMGGCNEDRGGDLVCDTSAELEPAKRPKPVDSGCPMDRDTCPNTTAPSRKGVDPIHNYMNYYDDSCLNEFTPGQVRHLHNMWSKFRKHSSV